MKIFRAGDIGGAAAWGAALLLLLASAGSSLAQRGGPAATAAGRRTETLNRQSEQYERDRLSREKNGGSGAPAGPHKAHDVAGQVRHDFEGLQAAYNKIVLAMAPKESRDFDSLLDSVDEVEKCASRLKANLALPKTVDEEEERAGGDSGAPPVEESLLKLRKHIYSFVTNPLFESAPGLNVEQAGKAARDLDMILKLSEEIRRVSRQKERHN